MIDILCSCEANISWRVQFTTVRKKKNQHLLVKYRIQYDLILISGVHIDDNIIEYCRYSRHIY